MSLRIVLFAENGSSLWYKSAIDLFFPRKQETTGHELNSPVFQRRGEHQKHWLIKKPQRFLLIMIYLEI